MRRKSVTEKEPATQVVKNIRRATRRRFSAEDKIRIVLEGLRGEDSIAELCRREGIVLNRKLPGHETLKNRAPGSTHRELGRYFIVDEYNNSITCQFVDLEKLGRELGVLRGYERVAD